MDLGLEMIITWGIEGTEGTRISPGSGQWECFVCCFNFLQGKCIQILSVKD